MSIRINEDKCIGCYKCITVCPGSLIKESGQKASIRYPRDCWGCVSCVKECPVSAIDFYLGADLGGNGSTMNISDKGDILHWNINKSDGTTKVIEINRKNSNKY